MRRTEAVADCCLCRHTQCDRQSCWWVAVCPLPRDDTLNTSFAEYLAFSLIFWFIYRCPINYVVPPVPPLSGIWGARAPTSSMAPPPMVTEHLKCRWKIIYVPSYRTSLTQGRLWPFEVVTLAHFRSLRGPILMQHDFFSLMLMSNQLSSISHTHERGFVVHQWKGLLIKYHERTVWYMIWELAIGLHEHHLNI